MAHRPPIGTRIRRAMERKRMNQWQLAAALGVSRSAVNAWINDRAYPMHAVGALEEVLEVRLSDTDPGPVRVVPGWLRREIAGIVADEDTRDRIIGLLEGTLTWPGNGAPSPGAGGAHPPAPPPAPPSPAAQRGASAYRATG